MYSFSMNPWGYSQVHLVGEMKKIMYLFTIKYS